MIESPFMSQKDALTIRYPNGSIKSFFFKQDVTNSTKIDGLVVIELLIGKIDEYKNNVNVNCCDAVDKIQGLVDILIYTGNMKNEDGNIFLLELHDYFKILKTPVQINPDDL